MMMMMTMDLKQGIGTQSLFVSPSILFSQKLKLHKFSVLRISASVGEKQLSSKERRELRKVKRENNPAYNWREEVEEKLIKKPKKRYVSWTEELNLDNLALLGPQWWVVRVSRVSGHYTAQRMARSLARNFPSIDFKVFIPSVQVKQKLKDGSISVKPKSLFPGCVFLQCVLNKEVHDFIRECEGVGGFVGSRVGNTKRQINKPRPVDVEDMDAIFKQVKEEQGIADKAFLEENQGDDNLYSKTSDVDSSAGSVSRAKKGDLLEPKRRSRKTSKAFGSTKDFKVLPFPGSTVQIVSGSFAGFSAVLKKVDGKKGLVTVSFTLFGKETLADLDVNEVLPEEI